MEESKPDESHWPIAESVWEDSRYGTVKAGMDMGSSLTETDHVLVEIELGPKKYYRPLLVFRNSLPEVM